MQYRKFGQLDFNVSALGFGCMRLPTLGKPEQIDEPLAIDMIRTAIDQGVNYIDTAHPYHGGHSERLLAKALAGGYRQKVVVADKMPTWAVHRADDLDRFFDEQLERLQMPAIDFYLLHNLQAGSWARMRELNAIGWMEKQRERGRIKRLGFSFHDSFDVFKDIIDSYSGWEFCQIQYNYVNEDVQAGTRGLKYAAGRGLAVVVMEPLFGGTLANPPEPIRQLWNQAPGQPDPVDMALRWLWDQPEVSVVLSGMSAMSHVTANVQSAANSGVGRLTAAERELMARVCAKYKELCPIACTRCGYCMPCPNGVNIPENFQLYNNAHTFGGNAKGLNRILYSCQAPTARAENCGGCAQCEERCPQHLPISQWMPKVHTLLGGPA